ncbi:MAG: hypothetical protein JSV89_06055 [Spirochaetaceae bacterium]|nr:MAG: hypothetical protein JSV89_06055 [Spirochaetaceae bacterium]
MKPARILGFGLLLLLLLPVVIASDESEPFSQLPEKQTLLELSRVAEPWEMAVRLEAPDLQFSDWLPADLPGWEKQHLLNWIQERWLQSLPRPELAQFIAEIRKAHEAYLLATDDRGMIQRDDRGNPLAYGSDGCEEDYLSWQAQLGAYMEELLQRWEQEVQIIYQELLSSLDSDELPEAQPTAQLTLSQYKAEVRREFERLYRQAESQFIRLRLEQSPKNEGEELAKTLITRNRSELQTSQELPEADSQLISEHRRLPVALDAETWREEFCLSFERGIEAWNRAEQSFLDERVRWEADARSLFIETEQAWQKAYREFEELRECWIAEKQAHLQEGLSYWEQAESEFLVQYQREMQELAAYSKEELDRLNQELGLLLSLFNQNLDLIEVAEQNVELLQRDIATLEAAADPERADTLELLREELIYWQGENGDGGALGQCRHSLAEARDTLVDLESRIRAVGADVVSATELEREITRLESELLYLTEQLHAADAQILPEQIITQRRQAFQRIAAVLETLQQLEPSTDLDPNYLALKDRELSLINTRQAVLLTLESLEQSIGEIDKVLSTNIAELERSIAQIFALGPTYSYAPANQDLSIDMLSDFSAVGESAFVDLVSAYFSGDEAELAQKLSRDVTIWLTEMAALEGGCQAALRDFGLAYYYDVQVENDLSMEGRPRIDIPILGNPNYTVLVDEYLKLGPYKTLVWFEDGKLVQYKTVYPDHKLLPEDYLARESARVLEEIRLDPSTNRLYAYFKAMLASGHFVPGTDFIRDDLTDLAYTYIENAAAALQYDWETKWWLFKWWRVDEIAALRNGIAPLHTTGSEDRISIAATAGDFDRFLADRLSLSHQLEFLTGDEQSFVSALKDLFPLDGSHSALLAEAFDRLESKQLDDNRAILEAIGSMLENDLAQIKETISAQVSALFDEHQKDLEAYISCLYNADCVDPLLAEVISKLFATSGLPEDAYRDAELNYAKGIQSFTDGGLYQQLSEMAVDLYGLMDHRLDLLLDRVQQDLKLQFRRICDRRIDWEAKVADALASGLEQWSQGAKQLSDGHERWLREFMTEYKEKQAMWDGRYVLFYRNREQWIEQSTQNAVSAAVQSMERQMNLDADSLIGEIQTISIPQMINAAPELSKVIERAFPGPDLTDHLNDALAVDLSTASPSLDTAFHVPRGNVNGWTDLGAGRLTVDLGEEIFSRISLATALQMRVYIEEAEHTIHERIADVNRNMEDSLFDLMRASGYRRSGSEYSRSSVIDNTLFGGLENESQTVPAYRDFTVPDFDAGVDLSRASLEDRSGDYIQDMADRAQANLKKYMELVFGRPDEARAEWDWQGIEEEFKAYFDAQTALFQSSEGFHRKDAGFNEIDGLFPYHIGYQPLMCEDAPEEVQEPGYGELGVIMEAYFRNEARQARGLSMLGVPWYNLRIWDDDADNDGDADGWLEAPSTRDAVDLAVAIAATATGNVWVAAAINLTDDAVFTAADVSSGYVELEEGVLSFGKQALIGAATAGTGAGFDAFAGALGAFAEGGVCKALLEGTEIATNQVVGATVNAFELDADGELMFNTTLYKETLIGRQALSGYLAEFSGATVSNLLEGNITGFSIEHIADVRSFSQLAGALTQTGLEYALTGQTILNLADFSMFGLTMNDRILSGGFLELRLGGEQPQFALGQGGVDISPTAVADAATGSDTWFESMRIRGYDLFGAWETAEDYQGYSSVGTSMRSLYSFSDTEGQELYEELLSGAAKLLVGFSDASGQTQLIDESKQIQMATLGDYWNRNSRLMGGVVLQHEAHRDGVTSDALAQQLETRKAVRAHTEMALKVAGDYDFSFIENDPNLLRDVVASRIAAVTGDEFFAAYVDKLYKSEQADWYSIEKWSGKAIGAHRKWNSYYVIKLEQDVEDASKHDVRSTIGPLFFLVDKIHNLFSNKDRVEMYKPLFDIVGEEDYFGALKLLYGTGADVIGTSADVVGMVDDVITAYELIKNTEIPGSGTLNTVSLGLETIDQLISGVAAGYNAVIEKHFSDYWWMSGVPNFATAQSDLEDLTRFMFKHFVEGTPTKDIFDLYYSFTDSSPSIFFKHYETYPDWKIRYNSFGSRYKLKPYFTDDEVGRTDGHWEFLESYTHWIEQSVWFDENIRY